MMKETSIKRIIFAIIAGLMVLYMTCSPAYAASETYTSGYFEYQIEDESVSIVGYFGKDESIEIPSSIVGYPVSAIKAGAFTDAKDLKTITLPDTIMTVEEGAFKEGQNVIYTARGNNDPNGSVEPSEEPSETDETSPTSDENITEDELQDDEVVSMESIEPLDVSDESDSSKSDSSSNKSSDVSENESENNTNVDTSDGNKETSENGDVSKSQDKASGTQQVAKNRLLRPLVYLLDIIIVIAIVALYVVKRRRKKH